MYYHHQHQHKRQNQLHHQTLHDRKSRGQPGPYPTPEALPCCLQVGFDVLDTLASSHSIQWNKKLSHKAVVASGTMHGVPVMLCKPMTFMNVSGESVAPIMKDNSLGLSQVRLHRLSPFASQQSHIAPSTHCSAHNTHYGFQAPARLPRISPAVESSTQWYHSLVLVASSNSDSPVHQAALRTPDPSHPQHMRFFMRLSTSRSHHSISFTQHSSSSRSLHSVYFTQHFTQHTLHAKTTDKAPPRDQVRRACRCSSSLTTSTATSAP